MNISNQDLKGRLVQLNQLSKNGYASVRKVLHHFWSTHASIFLGRGGFNLFLQSTKVVNLVGWF